jgi:hypothetical protein
MLMAIFEITEMEMKGEGPSLRIDRFATEVETKVPKTERRQILMHQAKDIW